KASTKQEIPTASLPDIIFMLLIFFMVTTVLREVTLLVQNVLPDAEAIEKIEQKRLVSYVYIGEAKQGDLEGQPAVQIDDALVEDVNTIRDTMYRKLQEEPRMIVSLKVDSDAETGLLYDVQQELRQAQALRINYSTRRELSN
ncbi:MAG: biopolymer transporter ExbD, partial [Bacteroidota bacterium]